MLKVKASKSKQLVFGDGGSQCLMNLHDEEIEVVED